MTKRKTVQSTMYMLLNCLAPRIKWLSEQCITDIMVWVI